MEDHMKTTVSTLIITALCLLFACQGKINMNAEKDAIKALAQKESTSYYNRDYEAWADCWWHDASVIHMDPMTFNYYETIGWDSLNAQRRDNFNTEQERPKRKVDWSDWHIKVDQNLAWAYFTATESMESTQGAVESSINKRELRIAEKRDGKWKLTCVVAIDKSGYEKAGKSAEGHFHNAAAKFYFDAKQPQKALEILQLCARLYPDGYIAYNFMGYIYSQTGENKLAIQNFKKSLELNPANEDAKQWLEKLK